ncbi:helix-hairpin-helix domain-containing protein [Bdellovibrionota bacterium FG-1]
MNSSRLDAIALLEEIQRLMELKGENPFKIRAFEKAAKTLFESSESDHDLVARAKAGRLTDLPGIGKGISEVLTEFLLRGKSRVPDELKASLPAGLLELTQVLGLGPKKAMHLIEELGIHSLSELEYACQENRLLKIKGFGEKIQHKILEGVQFMKATQGQHRLNDAFVLAEKLMPTLLEAAGGARVSESGALRRRLETVSSLDFVVELPEAILDEAQFREKIETAVQDWKKRNGVHVAIHLHFAKPQCFGFELAKTTATAEHWKAIGAPSSFEAPSEAEFYQKLGIALISPEMRETGDEVELSRTGALREVLAWDGLRGVFHNHTTSSDGRATLEQMVVGAKKLGYQYIGISDHSQSAYYAQGLKPAELLVQEREIRDIQEKHPEIRIFWGIESDILADGSLDYDDKTLARFDFVIASVHSRFQMEREAMTERVLTALRHPSTRFLGHSTGRLLLGRPGFDLEMEQVIEEAARVGVAIEINANPQRLDIDWRWGPQLREQGTWVSINPDAHDVRGLEDTSFGVAMARKALLPSRQVVNAKSVQEVEKWLKNRR